MDDVVEGSTTLVTSNPPSVPTDPKAHPSVLPSNAFESASATVVPMSVPSAVKWVMR